MAPLLCAASYSQTTTLKNLLENGADVHSTDSQGCNALHYAAGRGDLEAIELLLAGGVGVNSTDASGTTPLMWTARHGKTPAAEALLRHGADIDAADKTGRTALMVAAGSGWMETVTALLRAGADASKKDERGETALRLARGLPNAPIPALLREKTPPSLGERLEGEGDTFAKAGRHGDALAEYVKALTIDDGDAKDAARLREKCLAASAVMDSPRPVSEEARRHMVMGMSIAKQAQVTADYDKAIDEIRQAVAAAPWWSTAYYNLAKLEETAGDYSGAIRDLKLYLIGSPNGDDRRQVQDHIYQLEGRRSTGNR